MIKSRSLVTALVVVSVFASSMPVLAGQVSTAAGGSPPEQIFGVFERVMEFLEGIFSTGTPEEGVSDNREEGSFSKNPFVYIAAFWTEIVNAPSERPFMERIIGFLEAVREGRE